LDCAFTLFRLHTRRFYVEQYTSKNGEYHKKKKRHWHRRMLTKLNAGEFGLQYDFNALHKKYY